MSCADLTLVDGELSCITAATYRFWLCCGIIPWMVLCVNDTRWVKAWQYNDVCETKLERGEETRQVMKATDNTTYDDDAPVAVETTCNRRIAREVTPMDFDMIKLIFFLDDD